VKLQVDPAAPDATRSVLNGEGLSLGQVDVQGSFSVLTYDKYGNAVVTERDGAVVRAVFTSSVDVADNWEASIVWRQEPPLVHFSAQSELFVSLKPTGTTHRIQQKVLTSSRKVDDCKPPIMPIRGFHSSTSQLNMNRFCY